MRKDVVLIGMCGSLFGLSGCGGGSVNALGTTAAPAGATVTTTGSTSSQGSFVNPTTAKTYVGVGGAQSLDYDTDTRDCCGQQALTYAGNQSTVRNSSISISYDPTSAIFDLKVTDPNANVTTDTRFQDPASRTDFDTAGSGVSGVEPQWGALHAANPNIRYLQAGDGDPLSPYRKSGNGFVNEGSNTIAPTGDPGSSITSTTLFYEVPGSSTQYVTFAGFIRNAVSFSTISETDSAGNTSTFNQTQYHIERGAFAYGQMTDNSSVPKTGSATYTGAMLATMVVNPTLDNEYGPKLSNYFQWIEGTSKVDVNFAQSSFNIGLNGTVSAGQFDNDSGPHVTTVPQGASFTAAGSGRIDLVGTGGFTGSFASASFGATTNGAPTAVNIAGSSVNGAFYGPTAQEVGGGFRIVGGNPDERIDILGAFTGRHP